MIFAQLTATPGRALPIPSADAGAKPPGATPPATRENCAFADRDALNAPDTRAPNRDAPLNPSGDIIQGYVRNLSD